MQFSKYQIPVAATFLFITAFSKVSYGIESIVENVTLTPSVGKIFFDTSRQFDDELFFSLGIGYQVHPNAEFELTIGTTVEELNTVVGPVDYLQWRADGLFNLAPSSSIVPYLVLGGGQHYLDQNGQSDTEDFFNFGFGAKAFLIENIAIRGDVRQFVNIDNINGNKFQDIAFQLGVTYEFGKNDRDTLASIQSSESAFRSDETSSSESPIFDESFESEATIAEASNVGDVDDFVVTVQDCVGYECEDVVPVNDKDQDGISDGLDSCPDTAVGAKVDDNGCYVELKTAKKLTLNIAFGSDSSRIPEAYLEDLEKVAEFMRQYPLTKVIIQGHTDDVGSEIYNQKLSERRAIVTGLTLAEKFGIARNRISYLGYGETSPLVPNDSEEARYQNRRVVALITAMTN